MTDNSWNARRLQILEEHETIRAAILELESRFDELIDNPAQAGEAWELPALVRSLLEAFKSHFEHEENGGLLGAGKECYDPEMLLVVEALIAEHREFERSLERILHELDFDFVPGETIQRCFDGELRKTISALAVHEATENALLEKLHARNVGRVLRAEDPAPG